MSKVSIIVPIYKVEQYINQCLDSLVNQTLKDIEIILIDDESPDNCGKICDEYAKNDSRIKVIHKKNGGVSAARNDGIKEATSDWIMFVDSDDWCELNMCEVAYENAVKNNVDIAIFNHYENYENSQNANLDVPNNLELNTHEEIEKLQMVIFHSKFTRFLDEKAKYYMDLGAPWSKIFKRSFLIKNSLNFNIELKGVFDDVFFCMYSLEVARKVIAKNIPIYHWRRLNNTLSNSYKKDNFERYSKITEECEKFVKITNKGEFFYRAYYTRIILNILKLLKFYYFNEKNDEKFRIRLKKLKELLNNEPYKTAIKFVKFEDLNKSQKVYLHLFKMKSPFLIWVFYKLKLVQQKMRKE